MREYIAHMFEYMGGVSGYVLYFGESHIEEKCSPQHISNHMTYIGGYIMMVRVEPT